MFRILFLFFSFGVFAQQNSYDFLKLKAVVQPDFISKSIKGEVQFDFKVFKSIDSIKIDAKNMMVSDVKINNKEVKFKLTDKHIILFEGYKIGNNKVKFNYIVKPKQTLYFVGDNTLESGQIWTQGQGRYTSHWLPSFDDVNEKMVFEMSVVYDNRFQVISNGKLQKTSLESNYKKWDFKMKRPMASYLVMMAIGNFDSKVIKSKSKTPIELYIDKNDLLKLEPTYRYSQKIFDYLEQEIQFKYPWKIYRQVPVKDFLYAGMENTTSTIFSQDFVVDEIGFNDRNYINVNAHELAHQWFGDVVTAKSSVHHWLQEGFATYYALLAEKEVFGEDYFYNELYDYALQLKRVAKTDTIPIMSEGASSLSYYKKGAWALHTLREDIGAENFQKIVKNYLIKYQFKNVETDYFLNEVLKVVPTFDTEKFKKTWLLSTTFDLKLAEQYLVKNNAIKLYIELVKQKSDINNFEAILQSDVYESVKEFIFYRLANVSFEKKVELIDIGLKQGLVIRKAIAETVQEIPFSHQKQFEDLLNDNSYHTKEAVLISLCHSFPEKKETYLEKTKNIIGNNDKSFRMTWLKLAFDLPNYQDKKQVFFNELLDYATVKYESSIRQNALEILLSIDKMNDKVIEQLFLATNHHKWQFTKFSRETIRELLKDTTFRYKVVEIALKSEDAMKLLYNKYLNE